MLRLVVAVGLVAAAAFAVVVVELVEPVAELVPGVGIVGWLLLVVVVVVAAAAAGVVAQLAELAHSEDSGFAVAPSDLIGLHCYLPGQQHSLAGLPFVGPSAVVDAILVSHGHGLERNSSEILNYLLLLRLLLRYSAKLCLLLCLLLLLLKMLGKGYRSQIWTTPHCCELRCIHLWRHPIGHAHRHTTIELLCHF